jgi:hypothetical protein
MFKDPIYIIMRGSNLYFDGYEFTYELSKAFQFTNLKEATMQSKLLGNSMVHAMEKF